MRWKLAGLLVGEYKGKAILASTGEYLFIRCAGGRGEGLELVNVEVEPSAFVLGDGCSTHDGKLEFGDDELSEELAILFSEDTVGEVEEGELSLVHNVSKADGLAGSAEHVSDVLRAGKSRQAIDNGEVCVLRKLGVGVAPEMEGIGVVELGKDLVSVVRIFAVEKSWNVEQGGVREGE